MSERLVFDAGPLSAFAQVNRLDLLEARYSGRALWTVEIYDEIRRGVARHPALSGVMQASWLGAPVAMTDPAELLEIERLRWALGGGDADPLRHRGEAATIVLARREGATAALDDLDARRLASALGVPIVGTLGMLRQMVREDVLTTDEAWELAVAMREAGARVPPELAPGWFDPRSPA